MASSVSLCRHYAALSASTREPSATGHIHAGQLPKALSLLTHTHTHAGTHRRALAQRAKQIGGYYCHYNVYYCYPFNTKWPLLTGAILTFKCRRHCSKLTVRGQTATRLAASQRAVREWGGGEGAAADPVNVQLWRRAIKISAKERNSEQNSPGKCYANYLTGVWNFWHTHKFDSRLIKADSTAIARQ